MTQKRQSHFIRKENGMTQYEKKTIGEMFDFVLRCYTIGLPLLLLAGSVFFELIVKGV